MQLVCELKRMLRRIQNSRAIVFIELDTDDVKIVRKSRKKRDRIECRLYTTTEAAAQSLEERGGTVSKYLRQTQTRYNRDRKKESTIITSTIPLF